MKRLMAIIAILIWAGVLAAEMQSGLTLDACCKSARENYPLVKQYDLIAQSEAYTLSNAVRGYLPQVSLSGKATVQSDVTTIAIPFVNVAAPEKSQYQIGGEVSQIVWDGGAIRAQRATAKAAAVVEKKRVDTDLYALDERVQQIFFGSLMLSEQLEQNATLHNDLLTRSNKISAGVENGVANPADQFTIRVELLNTIQRRVELASVRNTYMSMLAALTGFTVDTATVLVRPASAPIALQNQTVSRLESEYFAAERDLIVEQKKSVVAANMPRVNLFAQGYYGRPGFNMLQNDFTWYGILGARFVWNVSGLTMQKNSIAKLGAAERSIGIKEETFLFNTKLKLSQHNGDIAKFTELIRSDNEIISLRSSIRVSTEAKVDNGILSITDLIRDITAENLAQQTRSLHEIQLLMAQYALKNTINK